MDIICHRNSYSLVYVKYSSLIWCNKSVHWDVPSCSCLITSMGCTAAWLTQYAIVIQTRSYMFSILLLVDVSIRCAKRHIPCRVFHCIVSIILVLSRWNKRYITSGMARDFTLGSKKVYNQYIIIIYIIDTLYIFIMTVVKYYQPKFPWTSWQEDSRRVFNHCIFVNFDVWHITLYL
jgi:hypothetical protein